MIFIEPRNSVTFVKGLDTVININNICSSAKWGERDEPDPSSGTHCRNLLLVGLLQEGEELTGSGVLYEIFTQRALKYPDQPQTEKSIGALPTLYHDYYLKP
jgi:hypothetical protein